MRRNAGQTLHAGSLEGMKAEQHWRRRFGERPLRRCEIWNVGPTPVVATGQDRSQPDNVISGTSASCHRPLPIPSVPHRCGTHISTLLDLGALSQECSDLPFLRQPIAATPTLLSTSASTRLPRHAASSSQDPPDHQLWSSQLIPPPVCPRCLEPPRPRAGAGARRRRAYGVR